MITDNESWHYLVIKSISRLLRGITSNHVRDFYCLNCFHSYTTGKTLKKHERICKDHDFFHVKIPNENNKILKYNPGEKTLKVPFIIYADLECICQNSLEKSYTEKKLRINLQVTRELHAAHLITRKLNGLTIEEKNVQKFFTKI